MVLLFLCIFSSSQSGGHVIRWVIFLFLFWFISWRCLYLFHLLKIRLGCCGYWHGFILRRMRLYREREKIEVRHLLFVYDSNMTYDNCDNYITCFG